MINNNNNNKLKINNNINNSNFKIYKINKKIIINAQLILGILKNKNLVYNIKIILILPIMLLHLPKLLGKK